jgi:hypothetical protein
MPCRVAATPYPAYEIIVQSLVNAGWHYVYPAYKNTVMPSGNAGWHYVYPAYKTTVMPSGNAGWRCAYPAYKIVFSAFVGPVSVSATGHFFSGSAFSADR